MTKRNSNRQDAKAARAEVIPLCVLGALAVDFFSSADMTQGP